MAKKTLKERIIETSLKLFEEKGYHGVSVEQIVEQTGTSKGGFYHNFKSKDELLYHIHDIFISYVIEKAEEAYRKYPTPVSRLSAILKSFTRVFDVYKAHITVFYQESIYLPEEYKHIINEKRDKFRKLLEQVVLEGQKAGDFRREVPANISTMAIIGMINWTYKWYNPKGPMPMAEISAIFTDLILHSLATEKGREEADNLKLFLNPSDGQ